MSLIKCSECGKEISDKASSCPNCGSPLHPVPVSSYTTFKPQAPPVKKKGSCLLYFLIFFFVFFVIVFIVTQYTKSVDSASPENSSESSSSSFEETSEASSLVSLGSEGQSDDLLLKVNNIGEKEEIIEGNVISYKPDSGKYAIINVTLKNNGKQSISFSNGFFKLLSTDGAEYIPTILIGLDNNYINYESVNPGLELTGNLVFEVPSDFVVSSSALQFSGTGLFTSSISFALE